MFCFFITSQEKLMLHDSVELFFSFRAVLCIGHLAPDSHPCDACMDNPRQLHAAFEGAQQAIYLSDRLCQPSWSEQVNPEWLAWVSPMAPPSTG
eukprot:3734948-Amphidinium_carterae.1